MTEAKNCLALPRLISDGMVLQREQSVKIWGWAEPNSTVYVGFLGEEYAVSAGTDGSWEIELPPLNAGGPYQMEIRSGSEAKLIQDILIGDVWLAGGQSNMELPMYRVETMFSDEIAVSTNPYIREFRVPQHFDFKEPQTDVQGGAWVSASPETVPHFSAVGYFFAKALYQEYGVPIGLISTAIGGTPVQAWMSRDALAGFPAYLDEAEQCAVDGYVESVQAKEQQALDEWHHKLNEADLGLRSSPHWYSQAYLGDNVWRTLKIPCKWSDVEELRGLIGAVWFRRTFYLPKSLAGKPARLHLGTIVDSDVTYLNGQEVGTTGYQYPPRRYQVPAGLLKDGENVLALRVVSNNGNGEFIQEKPYELEVDGTVIDLTGDWQYKIGAAVEEAMPPITFFHYKPMGLFNGMIAPLVNYALKGVIWYQGESNTGSPGDYCALFSRMIADWRAKWKSPELPFLYVQLANWLPAEPEPSESGWAELRHQQLMALRNPHAAMAVAIDVGEWNDLHPLNKRAVGERLALGARALAYGEEITYSGPIYRSMEIKDGKAFISFDHVDGGLTAGGGTPLRHFAIAGPDGKFRWAQAEIVGDQVVVWHEEVPEPTVVRYAWADNPEGANLYNKAGLPASPFTTEETGLLQNER